jgi:hypothetical protein
MSRVFLLSRRVHPLGHKEVLFIAAYTKLKKGFPYYNVVFRRLNFGFPPRRLGFNTGRFHVRFMVTEVALEGSFLRVPPIFPS